MRNRLLFVFSFLLSCSAALAAETPRKEMFVSVIQTPPVLTSREAIVELISFSKKAGVQTLFVQIYRGNKAWFASSVGDSSFYLEAREKVGEDPFALLIREAHAAGIEVHAWVNLLSLSDNKEAPLLKKYGTDILTRNKTDKVKIEDFKMDNQYWLEPGDLRVRQEMSALVAEIARAYPDLDGLQLDYIRYPDSDIHHGHNMMNLKRFQAATGLKQFTVKTEEWRKWKRDQVTELVKLLVGRAKSINPELTVTTTGCSSYARAREEAFQDWAVWIEKEIVPFVTMMSYPATLADFEKAVGSGKERAKENFSKVGIGLPAYKLLKDTGTFKQQWAFCEKSGARACVVFHYGSLLENPELSAPLLPQAAVPDETEPAENMVK